MDQFLTNPMLAAVHVAWAADRLGLHSALWDLRFLDLGSGRGIYTSKLLEAFPDAKVTAVELDEDMIDVLHGRFDSDPRVSIVHGDLRSVNTIYKYDACISNPPYQSGLAETAVKVAVKNARCTSLLLRIPFLCGGIDRLPFWAKYKPTAMGILAPRPKFESEDDKSSLMSDFAFFNFAERQMRAATMTSLTVEWIEWKKDNDEAEQRQ